MNKHFRVARILSVPVMMALFAMPLYSQKILTLEECRELALQNNKKSAIAKEKVTAAEYDKKTARANYFPKVSAAAAYMHNSSNIALIGGDDATALTTFGTAASGVRDEITNFLLSNPLIDYLPKIKEFIQAAGAVDIAGPLNAIGQSVVDKFTFDVSNVYVGAVSVEEPLYVGGKIRAYNKVAAYAEELAGTQLDTENRQVLVTTDEAYWQIVSIAGKLRLANDYVALLRKLDSDVEALKKEGLATTSAQLSVKVKLNEAEMAQLRAQNGLTLSKMLLCQLCGLDIDSDIVLDKEQGDFMVMNDDFTYTDSDIENNRPELKSLRLAMDMYDQKVRIVRSDYLPTVALMGNYILTNPNLKDGFQNKMGGFWNVGVVAKIPVFHFGEGINKVRKAKSDALIARYQLDDVKGKISLQVTQNEQRKSEAKSRWQMAVKNLESAEENLRLANVGFSEGVLESTIVMEAQTAWMKAHSEEIDARIDCIMADVYLRQATGLWNY